MSFKTPKNVRQTNSKDLLESRSILDKIMTTEGTVHCAIIALNCAVRNVEGRKIDIL